MTRAGALALALWAASCQPLTLDGFLYDPLPAPPGGYQLSKAIIPAYEDLFVTTPDGERLHTVFVPAAPAATAPGRRPATIIYFHGQSNNIGSSWPRIELLYPLGYNVLAVDARGYGLSTGTPSEAGIEIDVQAARQALLARPDVDPARLVYYGRSFGGALAIHLASVAPPAVLVTESAFTSIAALVHDGAYVDLPRSFVAASVWDNLGKIAGIHAPYLALHGTADPYVQFRYAGELIAAHPGPHELVPVQGADHGNVPEVMGIATYNATLRRFIDAGLPP
jgi:fermentation-respiration switch protein FrsA (DUF1100 family)